MSNLSSATSSRSEPDLRPFLASAASVSVALAIAGFILAQRFAFPAVVAASVTAAFCAQAVLYCAAVSSGVRRAVRRRLGPASLAIGLVAASIAPYLIYSLPTDKFSPTSLLKLILLCASIAFPYVMFPVRKLRLAWQDAVVTCALAFPMISGLTTLFRDTYLGFDPPANRLDALGKLMLIPLGLFVFLELRRLRGTGFRLIPSRKEWLVGLESCGIALPWILLVGILTGYLRWDPPLDDLLLSVGAAVGKLGGIYFTTALAEEFLLRGVVQNLTAATTGRPLLSQAISAMLFGAVHLGRGAFPNLAYGATAAVLGWFCDRAYVKSGSVTAAMIAHALAVAGQELFF